MAIYKSSFNKKPEKPEKQPNPKKEKPIKQAKQRKPINKWWIVLAISSIVFIVCCLPSNFVKNLFLGIFGLLVYPINLMLMFFSVMFLSKKTYQVKKKYIVYLSVCLCLIWLLFHLTMSLVLHIPTSSYGEYLKATYSAKYTAGGLLFGLISYPLVKILTIVGAYIFTLILLAVFVGLIVDYFSVSKNLAQTEKKSKFNFDEIEQFNFDEQPKEKELTEEEKTKIIAKQKLGLEKAESNVISSSMPNYEINLKSDKPMSKKDYILTPVSPVIPPDDTTKVFNSKKPVNQTNNFEEIKPIESQDIYANPEEKRYGKEPNKELDDLFVDDNEDLSQYETAFETDGTIEEQNEDIEQETENEQDYSEQEYDEQLETDNAEEIEQVDIDLDSQDYVDEYIPNKMENDLGPTIDMERHNNTAVDISKFNLPNQVKKTIVEEKNPVEEKVQKLDIPPYVAPPADLLNYIETTTRITDEELQDNIDRLEQVLEDFKVPAKVNNVQVGPAVTRYELTMPRGISVNKIAQMSDDIAMTLASNGAIRVEAPIPGKNSVGVEVPNAQVSPVSLRELIDSEEFKKRVNPLSFVLGKDINGDIVFCNLDKMPHVLVAGSTGSGKSVCLNTMLLSMCYKAGPEDLRLILVDPKMVEFTTYNGLPHLLIPEVITGKDMTINALDWAIKEMERRYALFAKNHVNGIGDFNKLDIVKNKIESKLPFIVIVIEELADLMLEAKREIEDKIAKLAAKARAAGIHLVLATQRPSVDVITGTVKANLPSRIAFALTNYMDSKTVLDGGGAEKLLGKGDMLFKPQDKPEPRRVQGAYVSNEEIAKVVEYIKDHNRPVYDDATGNSIRNPHKEKPSGDSEGVRNMEFDPVLKEALRMFIQTKQASGSMISRRYSVGFNRAGRIMDQMEQAGFIGAQEGSKPRQVLITMEEYKAIFGDDN